MAYVESILRAYDAATPDKHARGRSWYADYRAELADHARATGTPMHRAVGVLAVSSINTGPVQGMRWTARTLAGGTGGHLGAVCDKAQRILATADTLDAARDIATPYTPNGSRKVRSFACNIATGGETCTHDVPCVTIDRWAHYIATDGADKSVPKGRAYDELAEAYRTAATMRGVSPAVMQAVTWCVVAE